MKCLNIHLIHCQVCDQPPTAEVTKTSSAEASGCGEMKRVRRNVKNLTKEEIERLVGAMQAQIDRGRYQEFGNIHGAPGNPGGTTPQIAKLGPKFKCKDAQSPYRLEVSCRAVHHKRS